MGIHGVVRRVDGGTTAVRCAGRVHAGVEPGQAFIVVGHDPIAD
jgi:hypothetical protein